MMVDANFNPYYTPAEMLELGVFEGKYMNDYIDEGVKEYNPGEFPFKMFEPALKRVSLAASKRLDYGYDSITPDTMYNYFKIKSRLSLQEWEANGWIYGPDKRGWFEWYCNYFYGRRIEGIDDIQIKRWKAFVRHYAQVKKHMATCTHTNVHECRPKQRQGLLQWAWDPLIGFMDDDAGKRQRHVRRAMEREKIAYDLRTAEHSMSKLKVKAK
jgi:hypothetical protein